MKRRTFDILVAIAGLFLAVTLAVAGGLALGATTSSATRSTASSPPRKSTSRRIGLATPRRHRDHPVDVPVGIPVRRAAAADRAQAEVWANDFIAVHLG